MKRRLLAVLLLAALLLTDMSVSLAAFTFEDTDFQGQLTTEALDALIEKYELYDGWYWTTQAEEDQNFHGQEEKPGWTDTAVNKRRVKEFEKGWYGCRWGINRINARRPSSGGYGECFGFAQFVGYLLSGVKNPQRKWKAYAGIRRAGGLRVGDIIRVEYEVNGRLYLHSAVVYSVNGDEALFMQVSGANYNMLRIRQGFSDGRLENETSIEEISKIPRLKVCRYEGDGGGRR